MIDVIDQWPIHFHSALTFFHSGSVWKSAQFFFCILATGMLEEVNKECLRIRDLPATNNRCLYYCAA